jgi:glycosyltransferase involved in cell wall biosynthesis
MRIGFDAKRAFNNQAGLGQYSRSLISALSKHRPDWDLHLYSPGLKPEMEALLDLPYQLHLPERALHRMAGWYWRSRGIIQDLKRDRLDIFHGLSQELPAGIRKSGAAAVVSIHDLLFLDDRQQYPFIDRLIYRYKVEHALNKADLILAVSEHTGSQIAKRYPDARSRIRVLHQTCGTEFHHTVGNTEKSEVRKRYGIKGSYLLNVSSFFPRKNQMALVEAMQFLPSSYSLVLVGAQGSMKEKIIQKIHMLDLDERIIVPERVPQSDMPALYQMAEMLVYPSLDEGFGIPLLEAFASGIPVVCSNAPVFKEVGADAVLASGVNLPEELAESIREVLVHESVRTKMIKAGRARLEAFRPERLAAQLSDYYSELVG